MRIETVDAEADHSFAPQDSAIVKYGEARQFRKATSTDMKGTPAEFEFSIGMPGRWGNFSRIDVGVKSVTELPAETTEVDRAPVKCRVLQVVYDDKTLHPEEQITKYWIDEHRLLVLKEQFTERQGRQRPPVFWQ